MDYHEAYTENFLDESKELLDRLPVANIADVMEAIDRVRRQGGTVYTIGNGGSASTAEHLAADLDKTANVGQEKLFRAITLVNNDPLTSAWTNDEGWDSVYVGQLEERITEDDALIGFSVHGGRDDWSSNLVNAMKFANKKGATTIGFAGFDGGSFKDICDTPVVVPIESTPQVESFHVLLHHLVVFGLKERVEDEDSSN
ncbi:MAG: SIS domain-containing protein [Candidatus Nanohaloarchaea archaeon]